MRGISRRAFLGGAGAATVAAAGAAYVVLGDEVVAPTVPPTVLSSGLRALRLVNWYPFDAPWADLWTNASVADIARDFGQLRDLGANAVRVIVAPDPVGYPTPHPTMAAKLADIVGAANDNGLLAQLTLFDFWSDYHDIKGSVSWAQDLLGPYHDSRALAFVELQNEIDPTDGQVLSWVDALCPVVKTAVGAVPVTVSVTADVGIAALTGWVQHVDTVGGPDFFDFHWYGPSGEAVRGLGVLASLCAPTPLFIGETGVSSVATRRSDARRAEAEQAAYLATVAAACRTADLPRPAPWVWRDFTAAALRFVGYRRDQLHFGLLRIDGTRKPAYSVVAEAFL